ncbi:hypothetical protein V2J09_018582 [Rumex salicifolius]
MKGETAIVFLVCVSLISVACGVTDPGDLAILNEFRKGLKNPDLLDWPIVGDDPCGPPTWKNVFCSGNRVTQIQAKNLGLEGPLPKDFNKLSKLSNLGLQNNKLSGMLPSFSGLSELQYVYLDNNAFDSIPADFFDGLSNLEAMALDYNPLNATTGWSLPDTLASSAQLTNLSLMSVNLVGPMPDFLGGMASLSSLKLCLNRLSGRIPDSFNGSSLQILWLNGQDGGGMTGPIDVISTMVSLTSVWLHGNQFSGEIPSNIGDLVSLNELDLNSNIMSGLIPESLANMELSKLDLNNNHFMGPIPKFKAKNVTYVSNSFCQSAEGLPCAPEVSALIDFLGGLNYPSRLVSSWSGNDPCGGGWLGLSCNSNQKVDVINLPRYDLNGTLSPSIANLGSLSKIILKNNNITGSIPLNWTALTSLTLVDLSGNNLSPPFPKFRNTANLVIDKIPQAPHSSSQSTTSNSSSTPSSLSSQGNPSSSSHFKGTDSSQTSRTQSSKWPKIVAVVAPVATATLLAFLLLPLSIYYCKRKKDVYPAPAALVVQPRDPSEPDNAVKIVIANDSNGISSIGSGSASSRMGESHLIESGNLIISVQVLRNVTKNFAPENELGRGGFGVVYKGGLDDGTQIAVKRMESGAINNKALNEFQSEIAVLSKVRHRHLVSLLGYSIEGNERILVYEYMPQGALSQHLFQWKNLKLEPLSWKRRLNIALDVARGIEYLHIFAHQSFIHRDLKSSNILLDDDFRAKVSDFGLVKLAPNGEKSVVTRLAGTFGYLAPEYAVTGKITTKVDVFSFGVVLIELLTGLMALDESRAEEKQYLAAWFWKIKSDNENLMAAIDPALDIKEDTFESVATVAELAGHCTAREPGQRPDMGHAVNVLSSLIQKWKPLDDDSEELSGIDYSLPLNQMVKGWQEAEGKDVSYMDLEDSKNSIPSRPVGFAESFTSCDGRNLVAPGSSVVDRQHELPGFFSSKRVVDRLLRGRHFLGLLNCKGVAVLCIWNELCTGANLNAFYLNVDFLSTFDLEFRSRLGWTGLQVTQAAQTAILNRLNNSPNAEHYKNVKKPITRKGQSIFKAWVEKDYKGTVSKKNGLNMEYSKLKYHGTLMKIYTKSKYYFKMRKKEGKDFTKQNLLQYLPSNHFRVIILK